MAMPKIHPTAIVDAGAELAEDVQVGPFCVVEADVEIGAGCVLREHVVVRQYTSMGERNLIDAFCCFGGEPQDIKFDPATVSYVRIGDDNLFREGCTISRATGAGNTTVVGSRTFWMAGAHAGHEAVIEDEAILVNGCAVGGHGTVGRRAFLSSHVVIHQYCWVGESVMTQGNAGVSTHVPPYTMLAGINCVVGLNVVGMRRADDVSDEDRLQVKEVFDLTYRKGLTPTKALAEMDARDDLGHAAVKFRDFLRKVLTAESPYKRPLCPFRPSR
jgi:UDP-N-acetylglucosamine acyltransferase